MPRTHPADTGSALVPIQAEAGSVRVGLAMEATFCWAGGRQRGLRWGAEPPQDPMRVAEPPTATQSLAGPHLAGRSSSWGVRRWGRSLGGTPGRCRRYCQPAERNVGRSWDEQWMSVLARGSASFGSHSSSVSHQCHEHPGQDWRTAPSPVPLHSTHQAHADGAVSI